MPPAVETMRCVSTIRSMTVRVFAGCAEDAPLSEAVPRATTGDEDEEGALLGTTRTATLLAREVPATPAGNIVPYTNESTCWLRVRASVVNMAGSAPCGFSETAAN